MMSKQRAAREARRMFHLCLVDGKLDEGRVRHVVQTILKSRHRGYLLLLGYFQRLVEIDYLRHLAKVESATPVPSDVETDIRDGLVHMYGSGITTVFSLKPALIGGMRIQVGSDVYDGSVRRSLEQLKRSFGIDRSGSRNDQIESGKV
jgi:F-type H+-transporting ATPase subunit delta